MPLSEDLLKRFQDLARQGLNVLVKRDEDGFHSVDTESFQTWASSAMHLVAAVFGEQSPHYRNLSKAYDGYSGWPNELAAMRGVFLAAKADYEGGYLFRVEAALSGEIFGDFVVLAKAALKDGQKDVAAVLACAALEDALKRLALMNGLHVSDKVMQEVVGALKSKGLVGGAQKTLLDTMPKIRDYAMHANWEKFDAADVGSVLGFVENLLLTKFS